MSFVEHLQRESAEIEMQELSHLQQHHMVADVDAHNAGHRRREAMNRVDEAEQRRLDAEERRQRNLDKRMAAQRHQCTSEIRVNKKRSAGALGLGESFLRLQKMICHQQMVKAVAEWKAHQVLAQHRAHYAAVKERRGSGGLFGRHHVHCSILTRLEVSGRSRQAASTRALHQMKSATVATHPILFEAHARRQRQNLTEVTRFWHQHGKNVSEVPQTLEAMRELSRRQASIPGRCASGLILSPKPKVLSLEP